MWNKQKRWVYWDFHLQGNGLNIRLQHEVSKYSYYQNQVFKFHLSPKFSEQIKFGACYNCALV